MSIDNFDNLESRKVQKNILNQHNNHQGDEDNVTYGSYGDTNQQYQGLKNQFIQINLMDHSRDQCEKTSQSNDQFQIQLQDSDTFQSNKNILLNNIQHFYFIIKDSPQSEQINPLCKEDNSSKSFQSKRLQHRKSIFQEESLLKQISHLQQSIDASSSMYDNAFEQQNAIQTLNDTKNQLIGGRMIINKESSCSNQQLQDSVELQQVIENSQNNIKKLDAYESAVKNKSQRSFFANIFERNQLQKKNLSITKKVELYSKKFITLLKNKSKFRNSENLTLEQRKLIDDKADQIQTFKKFSKQYFLFNIISYHLSKFLNNPDSKCVLMPTNTIKVIWDVFQIVFNFIFLFAYSIFLIYQEIDENIMYLNETFKVFTFFTFLDMLINCNSAYYLNDYIVFQRKQIVINYLKSNFIFDLISFASSLYKESNYQHTVVYNPNHEISAYLINILIFLRIRGVYSKRRVLDNIQQLSNFQRYSIKLFNQLIFMVTVAHIMGILWYLLGLYQQLQGVEVVWYTKYQQNLSTPIQLYITSFYWSVTTMITGNYYVYLFEFKILKQQVGYGDIIPQNSSESMFCAVSMIIFSCVYAYSINNIGMILEEIEKASKEMNDNITVMQRYI